MCFITADRQRKDCGDRPLAPGYLNLEMLSQRCGRHALRLAARRWPPTWLIGACPCAAVSGRRVPAGSTTAPGSSLARTASVALRYASTSSASASTERKERQAPRAAATNRELQTTDLLIAYRALVAAGVVQQDPEQIRALIEVGRREEQNQAYFPLCSNASNAIHHFPTTTAYSCAN